LGGDGDDAKRFWTIRAGTNDAAAPAASTSLFVVAIQRTLIADQLQPLHAPRDALSLSLV
jgi:hypothetical protein